MTAFIRVSKVTRQRSEDPYAYHDEEHDVTPDKLVPTAINVDTIRTFYPRKYGRPGTRINFTVGQGFAIGETVEQLEALLEGVATFSGTYPPVVAEEPQRGESDGESFISERSETHGEA